MSKTRTFLGRIAANALVIFARLVTAVQDFWPDGGPPRGQTVFFANHTSNGDLVLIWAALPAWLRTRTRPVAAADYWLKSPVREFIGRQVFDCVLIDRRADARQDDPVAQMTEAVEGGANLIIFPEGRRNDTDELLLSFKTGIFHLATRHPEIDFVPVWIENLDRVLPRGEIIPVPFICTTTFGAPIRLEEGESKEAFLERAHAAVLALADRAGATR